MSDPRVSTRFFFAVADELNRRSGELGYNLAAPPDGAILIRIGDLRELVESVACKAALVWTDLAREHAEG